ncbi:MAG: SDR family oxidoreductase [Oligoflexia bacterium]|nr:SDR family oxidoreductase [Oligoflexia bacterium]
MQQGSAALPKALRESPRSWLVTGAAGFIGSHLVEFLLRNGQRVRGLDNFVTGKRENLAAVQKSVGSAWGKFEFVEGDIANAEVCQQTCAGIHIVLHQAALGSVPRSIADPQITHRSNVDGYINMLEAARARGVDRFVYASSSSVYGDHPELPKREDIIGNPLSPYAASKLIDEVYAGVWFRTYGLPTIGLRYFNVFGPRQDPEGQYAAVIPRWLSSMQKGQACIINGDGETSRDFCFIENVVHANLLAATANASAFGQVFNIACGERTSLRQLHDSLQRALLKLQPKLKCMKPSFGEFRSGDVRHSLANISKANTLLGYSPLVGLEKGLEILVQSAAENQGS